MSMKMIYSECLMKNQTEDGIKFLTAMYGNSFAISVELTDRVCKEVYEGKMPKEEKSSKKYKDLVCLIVAVPLIL